MAEQQAGNPPAVWNNLTDIPGVRQAAMLVSIAACVALGVGIMFWARSPQMSVLYSNVSAEDAAEMATALQAAGIEYSLDNASGAIMVPAKQVHDARLSLAGKGLPRSNGVGLELMQQEQGMGVSQFMENARYHHALETELARTISALQTVSSARVHLALPRQSVFVRDRKDASASVMLNVYPGLLLQSDQVGAIVHMVASSIPGLDPRNVAVVDQQGRLLSEPMQSTESAQTVKQLAHTRRIEDDYVRRIEDLLMPLFGFGRVRATVAVDMDYTESEETRERFDPATTALRSEQTSEEERRAGDTGPGGIPGALSNQPPVTGADAAVPVAAAAETADTDAPPAPPTRRSTSATRNFEVDRTISHVRQPGNRLRRLSVGVVIDDRQSVDEEGNVVTTPISAQELASITALVRQAVGFDEARGDTIEVMNSSFSSPPESEVEALPLWERPEIMDLVKQGLGILLVGLLIMLVLRPMTRNLMQAPQAVPAMAGAAMALPPGAAGVPAGAAVAGLPGAAGAQPGVPGEAGAPLALGGQSYEQRIASARELAGEEPERVAQVVKKWVDDNG